MFLIKKIILQIYIFIKFLIFTFFDLFHFKKKYQISKELNLLIVRLDEIGDYMLFRNFLEIVKLSKKFSNYNITFCGNEVWRDIAETYDGKFVKNFIWVNKSNFQRNISYREKITKQLQERSYKIVINPLMSRSFFLDDTIIKYCYAEKKIGVETDLANSSKWQKNISDNYYSTLIKIPSEINFEFNKNKYFFSKVLDEKLDIKKPSLIINNSNKEEKFKNYAVVFPGASRYYKRWSPQKFAEVSNYLIDKYKLNVIIAGSKEDSKPATEILNDCNSTSNIFDYTGKTSLSELAELISNSEILISNDTGVVHIAVALDIKVVCLLNGNHIGRFSPYPKEIYNKIISIYPPEIKENFDNLDYLYNKYKYRSYLDINKINVEDVFKAIDKLLID